MAFYSSPASSISRRADRLSAGTNRAGGAPPAVADAEPGRTEVKRQITKAPTFVSLYANDVQVQISPWDVRLIFGEIGDIIFDPATPIMNITQVGDLRISPQLAKKLITVMQGQIKVIK